MIDFKNKDTVSNNIVQAMKSGDEKQMADAWGAFHSSVVEQIKQDFEDVKATQDADILAKRGYRQLTSKETKFYQALAQAMRSESPRQAFTTILDTDDEGDIMPETIIEDVYRDLRESHPLLSMIDFQYVGYATKWILSDTTVQKAAWGTITAEITQAITGAFRVVDVHQAKLTAYAFIENGMLDLGPTFLDGYIRTCLTEALSYGLVDGIINGNGLNQPVGLTRDIHKGVSFSSSTGYPEKTAGYGLHTVTDFTPTTYGGLVAEMAKAEPSGRIRPVQGLTLVCNPVDYYTKVMPATTVLNANGVYVNDLFPIPTTTVQEPAMTQGKAVLFMAPRYHAFAGGERNGVIDMSTDYKFVEDLTYFKIRQYATGMAEDNNCALLLDISGLKPGYINVAVNGSLTNTTTVSGSVETTPTA